MAENQPPIKTHLILPCYIQERKKKEKGKEKEETEGKEKEKEEEEEKKKSWKEIVSALEKERKDMKEFRDLLFEMGAGEEEREEGEERERDREREMKNFIWFERKFENAKSKETKNFFSFVLPFIQNIILKMPSLFSYDSIPLLKRNTSGSVTLSAEQICCLICGGILNCLPLSPTSFCSGLWPEFSFQYLLSERSYQPSIQIMNFIYHYIERCANDPNLSNRFVTFTRQFLPNEIKYKTSKTKLCTLKTTDNLLIEDSKNCSLHSDFANEFIGGGVLEGGCVQEEILFCIKPQCIVSMCFCEKMEEREVIFIKGAERFSKYCGYGATLRWDGPFYDQTSFDSANRRHIVIVAMDAVINTGYLSGDQFSSQNIERDILKAYNAFHFSKETEEVLLSSPTSVATGNWGCGAFGGDPGLKLLQQWVAASEAGKKEIEYCCLNLDYRGEKLSMWGRELARLGRRERKGEEVGEEERICVGDVVEFLFQVGEERRKGGNKNVLELFIKKFDQ